MEGYDLTNLQETNDQGTKNCFNNNKIRDTDVMFKYVFAIMLSTWLGLVAYVFISGNGLKFLNENTDDIEEVERKSLNYPIIELLSIIAREPFHGWYHKTVSPVLLLSGIYVAVAFMLNCFAIVRRYPRISSWIGSICVFGLIVKSICEIDYGRPLTFNPETFAIPFYVAMDSTLTCYVVYITKIFFCSVALLCLKRIGIAAVANILAQMMNALIFSATLIIFGLFILTLEMTVVFFSIVTFYSFSQCTIILYFFLLDGIYLITFILYYGKIVIAPTMANWYFSTDKTHIPISLVLKNIASVSRYHFGTISLASIPMLPSCIALFVAYTYNYDKNRSLHNRILDSILVIYLTWNTIDYSLITTSMYGQNFYQSTKKTFLLMTQNSSLSLACAYIFYAFLLAGAYITSFTACIPTLIWAHKKPYLPSIYAIVLILPVFLLLDLFGQVYLLCFLADNEAKDDTHEDNMSRISLNDSTSNRSISER